MKRLLSVIVLTVLLLGCTAEGPEASIRKIREAAAASDFRSMAEYLSGTALRSLLQLYGNRARLSFFYRKFVFNTQSGPVFLRTIYSPDGTLADCRFLERATGGKLLSRVRIWRMMQNGKRWKLANIVR